MNPLSKQEQLDISNYTISRTTFKTAVALTARYAKSDGRLKTNYTKAKWDFIEVNKLADLGVYLLKCCNRPVGLFSVDILDNWLLFGRIISFDDNRKIPIPFGFLSVYLVEQKVKGLGYKGLVYTGNIASGRSTGTLNHEQLKRLYTWWEKTDPQSTLVSSGFEYNERFVFLDRPIRFRGITQVVRYICFEGNTEPPDIVKMDKLYFKKITKTTKP